MFTDWQLPPTPETPPSRDGEGFPVLEQLVDEIERDEKPRSEKQPRSESASQPAPRPFAYD